MPRWFLPTTAALCAHLGLAHARPASAQSPGAAAVTSTGEFRGRLIEAGTGRPIGGGSVTVRRAGLAGDTAFAGGALPRDDGSFRVDGLAPGRYALRVRAIGYAPLVRSDLTVSPAQPVVDLGALTLTVVAARLQGQVVTAERDEVALAPDRNSYSTRNMATASGGTAVDVLRNVPSVEVDGSNNLSLRGNANVVVQINGRSSPLRGEQLGNFLAQLPAHSVSRVEVATNPSAKNDPEGTAGIINIVLNQEAELGLSGGFSATTGTTGTANLSGNVGRQRGPLTLFLSGSHYRDSRASSGTTSRTNLAILDPAFVESRATGRARPRSAGLTFRSEYRLGERDAISADAIVYDGRYARANATSYVDLDPERAVVGLFDRYSDQLSSSLSEDYALAFRRTGAAQATTFSTELRFSRNAQDGEVELRGAVRDPDATTVGMEARPERDATSSRFPAWNLQSDYTHPFGARTKLEAGVKGTLRETGNDFAAAFLDSASGRYAPDLGRATSFDYRERIGAAYAVLSRQLGRAQAQAGLRLERAATRLDAVAPVAAVSGPGAVRVEDRYASAFPSAILTYNVTERRQAKLSYSRRISRPNPYQLSPIAYRDDSRNVFRGNPALRPEYTDALELGLQESRPWGSVQVTPFVRATSNAVRYVQAVDTSGATLGTFDNLAVSRTAGADVNVTYRRGPITAFTGGSVFHYASDASNLPGDLSTTALAWSVRGNVTWKLSSRTDAQLFANYRAPQATEGGSQTAFVFLNLAVRRKLWGDKGSASLRVADPFDMMSYGYQMVNQHAVETGERRFGQRGVFLTVSRNFGQQLKLRPRTQEPEPQAAPAPGGP